MKKIFLFIFFSVTFLYSWAQSEGSAYLDDATNGDTVSMTTVNGVYYLNIYDDAFADGTYRDDATIDRYIVVDSGNCEGDRSMSLYFTVFDIDPGDTLFIYDGPNTSFPKTAHNNNLNPLDGVTVYPTIANTFKMLTIRFKTNGDGINGKGFAINVQCRDKCETITPVIDSLYYKVKNGVIIDSMYTRWVQQVDTNWSADSTSFTLDTQFFRGVHLCEGEQLVIRGHGEYTNYYGYNPNDEWSMFDWSMGNGKDTSGIGLVLVPGVYRDVDCYDVTLRITDYKGCKSTLMESVKVRIAQNPIKTIYDLNPMCTTDSSIVNIGYGGANATISMQYIEFSKMKSRSIDCKTFLPDGANYTCADGDNENCFNATITFDDFPPGRVVQSAEDICSICINFEHSYLGDLRAYIVCPSKQQSVLWYGTTTQDPLLKTMIANDTIPPAGAYNGSYQQIGIPYGGSFDGDGDYTSNPCVSKSSSELAPGQYSSKCDSVCNMYGYGYDYCFSRNGDYMLTTGKKANTTTPAAADYFCDKASSDTTIVLPAFITIPAPYINAGFTSTKSGNFTTKKWSDHEGKRNYYIPADDFHELIGCPLNGDWSIRVCDTWGSDNGWIFEWALDFCGISSGTGCEYQVDIDSVIWKPDSAYGDFDLGYWRGLTIDSKSPVRSVIHSHDTAGYFPIDVKIYDNFGCIWDTTTGIRTIWSPVPDLGNDTILCDVERIILDAKDRHSDTNFTYKWEPFGQDTDTIMTSAMMGSSTLYTVEVEHSEFNTHCHTRDSIRVNVNRQPLPNFDPGVYPLEGCEPYTIHFENTSQFADSYLWVFGDGDSSTAKSPTHTFGTGQYDFKYYVRNDNGCNDSLIYSDLITVYSSPVARFSWEPMNPTVMHPSVQFHNLTIPQSDNNKYYWEIQYDRDNTISYHTLRDVNPTFEWDSDGDDISGNYIARLIAMTQNMGPSGNIVECRDTIENRILLVNDFLQFPNAVTPNGDGVNDRFVIKNLVNGLGYPTNSLAIYDRWGKRVYYKENIASDSDFWDPAADHIPAGTYFWRFVGKGYLGDIQRNGVVEVIY